MLVPFMWYQIIKGFEESSGKIVINYIHLGS